MNNEKNCRLGNRTEIVSINFRTPINMTTKDELSKEIRCKLNNILPVIEGNSNLVVDKVVLKLNQKVVSGILLNTSIIKD